MTEWVKTYNMKEMPYKVVLQHSINERYAGKISKIFDAIWKKKQEEGVPFLISTEDFSDYPDYARIFLLNEVIKAFEEIGFTIMPYFGDSVYLKDTYIVNAPKESGRFGLEDR